MTVFFVGTTTIVLLLNLETLFLVATNAGEVDLGIAIKEVITLLGQAVLLAGKGGDLLCLNQPTTVLKR